MHANILFLIIGMKFLLVSDIFDLCLIVTVVGSITCTINIVVLVLVLLCATLGRHHCQKCMACITSVTYMTCIIDMHDRLHDTRIYCHVRLTVFFCSTLIFASIYFSLHDFISLVCSVHSCLDCVCFCDIEAVTEDKEKEREKEKEKEKGEERRRGKKKKKKINVLVVLRIFLYAVDSRATSYKVCP